MPAAVAGCGSATAAAGRRTLLQQPVPPLKRSRPNIANQRASTNMAHWLQEEAPARRLSSGVGLGSVISGPPRLHDLGVSQASLSALHLINTLGNARQDVTSTRGSCYTFCGVRQSKRASLWRIGAHAPVVQPLDHAKAVWHALWWLLWRQDCSLRPRARLPASMSPTAASSLTASRSASWPGPFTTRACIPPSGKTGYGGFGPWA